MDKILVNIDSRYRDYITYPDPCFFRIGHDAQKSTNFNNYINFKNIDYISVSSAEIPNNFFVFEENKYNNFFRINFTQVHDLIEENEIEPTTDSTITINGDIIDVTLMSLDNSNYTIQELCNNINIKLQDKGYNIIDETIDADLVTQDILNGIYFKYDEVKNRIVISNKSNKYGFTIYFDNDNNEYISLGYMMGARTSSLNFDVSDSQNLLYAPDINGSTYIFLRINNYGSTYISHQSPKKVLAKLILNSDKSTFTYINNYDGIFKKEKFRQPQDINKLEMELLDYRGNRLDNNGSDYSITLEMGQIYDETLYVQAVNKLDLNDNTYVKNLNNKTFDNYTDNNYSSVPTTTTDIMKVFTETTQPVINKVVEMENLEEKRKKSKVNKSRKKKKKFGFEY